ncbi:TauD/TfdA family dioxygenase, partial [Cronobacter sakazakii]
MTTTLNATPVAAQPFTITPFARLGAEITGLDLRLPVNNADFARIHQAHLDHHVVVF